MTQLQGDRSKIDACTMQNSLGMYEHKGLHPLMPRDYMQNLLEQIESILPTRLTDETFRGIMDFINATKAGASMDQIREALVRNRTKCFHYSQN